MDIPSFKEDHISQIPALQMLIKLGYTYIRPSEADRMRGNKTSNVILEDVLRKQLKEINSIKVSAAKTALFTDENIEKGIIALKNIPMQDGYINTCEKVYHMLTLGLPLEQTVDGDKKSYTLQYIDWKYNTNNVFHVTEEYSVMRSKGKDHYRPDLVLFVNGIPLCVIECKRPDMKEPLHEAISQQLRNQQEDGITQLFIYTQLLLCIASQECLYATNGTPQKFWAKWQEKFTGEEEQTNHELLLNTIKNERLPSKIKDALFADRYKYVRSHFDAIEGTSIYFTEQDEYIYNLCHPKRLMDLFFNFIVFDNGEKKIARYQQFFAIKKTIHKVKNIQQGRRMGGVIWHTQGSGKSLTMVMLAQAIKLEPSIKNPKIILVTDRTDLDDQITKTFRKCGVIVENASTGKRLVDILENKSDAVVTTIINKFTAAVKKITKPLDSHDIFVLIDEGHRTQHGIFNINMQKTLPNACFIAMTGTPLFKKEKSTASKFGGIIDDYTVEKAVKDKAVVPLLYEGRVALQDVNDGPIDTYFDLVTDPFNDKEKSDFKKKYAKANQLNDAEQKIRAISWNISQHFKSNWQGTGFKAQLICSKKSVAIKYKEVLDEIGIVSSELLISASDDREGEDTAYDTTSDYVKKFWDRMMREHGNQKSYEKNIINRFKNDVDPEIIIVVDKLLTGFDEPKNTILYNTRNLTGHKLLQAIARVNRLCNDKDFGYIIDYYGVIQKLGEALDTYSSMEEFDKEDIEGTLHDVGEEIKKLPQLHSVLWDIFKTVENKRDAEAYQHLLRDIALRVDFYERLTDFAKAFKIAMSTMQFHSNVPADKINMYKEDLAMFIKLKAAVMQRYSDKVDFKKYESQIQKLIDTHVTSDKVEVITSLVNIFDKEKFQQELDTTQGDAAKADKILSRTEKHITEKMDEDPAFYKRFSQMIREAISDYETGRISEAEYLDRAKKYMIQVLNKKDDTIPQALINNETASAYYGISVTSLKDRISDPDLMTSISIELALFIDKLFKATLLENNKPVIDWHKNKNLTGKLKIEIGDYIIDEVTVKYKIDLTFQEIDAMAHSLINIAEKRYKI